MKRFYPRFGPPPGGAEAESRTERPATGRCGLRLPSPLRGLPPTAPGGFASEGRSFQLPAAPGPTPPGRGHRPWVEAAQNARHLDVAGFACQAPCGGCAQPPPAVSPHEGRSFQLPAASSPTPLTRDHHPWVEVAQNARQLDVAGFACKAPSRGLHPTAPGGFASRRPQFSTAGRIGPNALGRVHRPWLKAAQNARQLDVAGSASPAPSRGLVRTAPAVSPHRRPQFPTAGRLQGPTSPAAAIARGWEPHRTPGNWTLRASSAKPPDGGCAQPPLAVSQAKAAVSNSRPSRGLTPLAVASVRGWKPHRTPGNWKLRASSAKPPPRLRPTALAVSPHEGRSFQLPAVPRPTSLAASSVRGWKLRKTPGN